MVPEFQRVNAVLQYSDKDYTIFNRHLMSKRSFYAFTLLACIAATLITGCSNNNARTATVSGAPTPPPAGTQLAPITTAPPVLPADMPAAEKAQILADQQVGEARANQQRQFYFDLARSKANASTKTQ